MKSAFISMATVLISITLLTAASEPNNPYLEDPQQLKTQLLELVKQQPHEGEMQETGREVDSLVTRLADMQAAPMTPEEQAERLDGVMKVVWTDNKSEYVSPRVGMLHRLLTGRTYLVRAEGGHLYQLSQYHLPMGIPIFYHVLENTVESQDNNVQLTHQRMGIRIGRLPMAATRLQNLANKIESGDRKILVFENENAQSIIGHTQSMNGVFMDDEVVAGYMSDDKGEEGLVVLEKVKP